MSNGEVKIDEPMRWNVPRPDFIKEQEWQAHDGHIMVVLASDHDRVVQKQAKVIEVLKACILKEDKRCGIWREGRQAIERAEGEKE